MNKKIRQWQKLVELAEIEMDNAAKTVGLMRQNAESAEQQLASLRSYADELSAMPADSIRSSSQIQTSRLFVEKVFQAVEVQKHRLLEDKQMVAKAQEAWLEKRAHFKAMSQLLKKIEQEHEHKLSMQEQKMLDELASQRASASSRNSS